MLGIVPKKAINIKIDLSYHNELKILPKFCISPLNLRIFIEILETLCQVCTYHCGTLSLWTRGMTTLSAGCGNPHSVAS